MRLTPKSKRVEILATGARNPNGMSISHDGRFVTTSFQEGTWTASSGIVQVDLQEKSIPHFGNHGARNGKIDPPLLRLPRGEDNSSGGQVFLGPKAWPQLAENHNFVYLSYGMGTAWMVTRQQVGKLWQGAAMRLTGSLRSGLQQGRFNPRDGQLWVSGLNGWQSYTPDDGCLQRIRPSANVPVLIAHEVRRNGILLRTQQPISERSLSAQACFAQAWNYAAASPAYGSPEFSVRQPNQVGHDRLTIRSISLVEAGRAVFIEITDLIPAQQVHLRLPWWQERDANIFLTVHAQAPDYTEFPGYQAHDHTAMAPTPATGSAGAGVIQPVRWEEEMCGGVSREIKIQCAPGLQFAPLVLNVKAGEPLKLVFHNPDSMPHNWVLTAAGQAETVVQAAGLMADKPDAYSRHYTPDLPSVLAHTRVILPGETSTIWFQAPTQPGRYLYLCTIPGHAQSMRGTLVVSE